MQQMAQLSKIWVVDYLRDSPRGEEAWANAGGGNCGAVLLLFPTKSNLQDGREALRHLGQGVQVVVNDDWVLGSAGEPIEMDPFKFAYYVVPGGVAPVGSASSRAIASYVILNEYGEDWSIYMTDRLTGEYLCFWTGPRMPQANDLRTAFGKMMSRVKESDGSLDPSSI
mmetsp:Transcript_14448/g.29539  ORF Transcript_14448/g.29539 Transcript_14448/m.29539 type:complete len:169 (-) Transcript_14448:1353-1859(-)